MYAGGDHVRSEKNSCSADGRGSDGSVTAASTTRTTGWLLGGTETEDTRHLLGE